MTEVMNNDSRQQKKDKKARLPLSAYLSYLLLAALLLTGISFSRYVSTASGTDTVNVAAFVVEPETDAAASTSLSIDCADDIGISASYPFGITNVNDKDVVCEVSMIYDIIVTLPDALDTNEMSMELRDAAGMRPELETVPVDEGMRYTFSGGQFDAGVAETHNYNLYFKAKDVAEDVDINSISIEVHAVQSDDDVPDSIVIAPSLR